MKQWIDVEGEGLEALMGQTVTLFCLNYFYSGKLVGVNDAFVKLESPKIIFETGSFSDKEWGDAHSLPEKHWYVATQAIESFGVLKK